MADSSSVQDMLERIGGSQLKSQYASCKKQTPIRKALPNANEDIYSYSYCIIIGGLAALSDGMLDNMFRAEMVEKHRLLSPEEQNIKEKAVNEYLKKEGLKPESGPSMGMDYYAELNEELNLPPGFKLRPKNHRILNHSDRDSVIEMLMKGEAGFEASVTDLFPKMTFEQASKLYDLHIAADRGTPQSLPLKFMSWLWQEGVKHNSPSVTGDSHSIYKFLQKLAPNSDWSGWVNKFLEGNPIESPATLGEAMLKLYDLGIINERVFWTSNLGAAVGGFKRRLIITVLMELAVELYALFEGVRLGYIRWNSSVKVLTEDILSWRDQPKYVDMKIIIQCMASSYGVIRTIAAQDPLSLNITSMAMTLKHLICYPAMIKRHHSKLIAFSRQDVQSIDSGFMQRTGIQLPFYESMEQIGMHPFDQRIIDLGCYSTRVRVLGSRYEERLAPLISRMEKLSAQAELNDIAMKIFDALCETWYLGDIEGDEEAIKRFESDIKSAEQKIGFQIISS